MCIKCALMCLWKLGGGGGGGGGGAVDLRCALNESVSTTGCRQFFRCIVPVA